MISGNGNGSALSTNQNIVFRFIVPQYVTAPGESLKIVGSLPELGGWDLEAAPSMTWNEGHRWVLEMKLPKASYEFKVVMVAGHALRWEQGVNRVVETGAGVLDAPVELVINLTCNFDITTATSMDLVLSKERVEESYELAKATLELLQKRRGRLRKAVDELRKLQARSSPPPGSAAEDAGAKAAEVARLEAAVAAQATSVQDLSALIASSQTADDGTILLPLPGKVELPVEVRSMARTNPVDTLTLTLGATTSISDVSMDGAASTPADQPFADVPAVAPSLQPSASAAPAAPMPAAAAQALAAAAAELTRQEAEATGSSLGQAAGAAAASIAASAAPAAAKPSPAAASASSSGAKASTPFVPLFVSDPRPALWVFDGAAASAPVAEPAAAASTPLFVSDPQPSLWVLQGESAGVPTAAQREASPEPEAAPPAAAEGARAAGSGVRAASPGGTMMEDLGAAITAQLEILAAGGSDKQQDLAAWERLGSLVSWAQGVADSNGSQASHDAHDLHALRELIEMAEATLRNPPVTEVAVPASWDELDHLPAATPTADATAAPAPARAASPVPVRASSPAVAVMPAAAAPPAARSPSPRPAPVVTVSPAPEPTPSPPPPAHWEGVAEYKIESNGVVVFKFLPAPGEQQKPKPERKPAKRWFAPPTPKPSRAAAAVASAVSSGVEAVADAATSVAGTAASAASAVVQPMQAGARSKLAAIAGAVFSDPMSSPDHSSQLAGSDSDSSSP